MYQVQKENKVGLKTKICVHNNINLKLSLNVMNTRDYRLSYMK